MTKVIVFNESYYSTEDFKHYYQDFLSSNELTKEDFNFYEFMANEKNRIIENMLDVIKDSEVNTECVIFGELGLWNGRKEIVPSYQPTLLGAIYKCVSDYELISIEVENNRFNVVISHHDGTNYFSIALLNKRYQDGKDFTKSYYHKTLPKNIKDLVY